MMPIISLGAGVQSTTMALMAAQGKITPMPVAAIFADTGWEPKAVYAHLDWLMSGVLPFPVYVVSAGNLRVDAGFGMNREGKRFNGIPWFTLSGRGKQGMGQRQCTYQYKLRPIRQKIAEMTGGRKKASAEIWLGISLDEATRMRPSGVQYIENRYPLIEKRISRRDCLKWLAGENYPQPPKSACVGCPFRSDDAWRALSKEEFQDAVEVDHAIRHQQSPMQKFAHRSLKPLDEVDFSVPTDWGQLDLFNNECEGMCGI
jgi:hypothetical protein